MDTFELKKEQQRLARKVRLQDGFSSVKTVGGIECSAFDNKLVACVVVLSFPSMEFIEKQTYVMNDPLPYRPGYVAYREMPAMMEAFNMLEEEPDVLFVKGLGINHPRRLGLASHVGLALNIPTIGVVQKLVFGSIADGKIECNSEIAGFEIKTREHSNPVFVAPGNLISLGSVLQLVKDSIRFPHKMPEPLHVVHKVARKKIKKVREE